MLASLYGAARDHLLLPRLGDKPDRQVGRACRSLLRTAVAEYSRHPLSIHADRTEVRGTSHRVFPPS